MHDFGPFAVAIAVFVFLAIAAVAGIVGEYKKRQATLELLRGAIERGQPLDVRVPHALTLALAALALSMWAALS